jgi:hypothetical protein
MAKDILAAIMPLSVIYKGKMPSKNPSVLDSLGNEMKLKYYLHVQFQVAFMKYFN